MLEKMIEKVKAQYSFAKYLNYAYKIGNNLFGLVFTPTPIKHEILGGSIIIINSTSLKMNIFPVRPQIITALNKMGKVEKVFSVNNQNESELMHYGILGQKWGIRNYQNSDGSLTTAGKARYTDDKGKLNARAQKDLAITPRGQMTDRGKRLYLDANGKLNSEGKKYFKETDKGRIVKKNRTEIEEAAPKKSFADRFKRQQKDPSEDTRSDSQRTRDLLKRNPKTLSNQEMQEITNRLQLEQRYSQLTTKPPSAATRAVRAALPILGTMAVGTIATKVSVKSQNLWKNFVDSGGLKGNKAPSKLAQLGSPYYSKLFNDSVPKVSQAVQNAMNAYYQNIDKDK